MCHTPDSRPPAPPEQGEVAEQGPLSLTAADGSRLSAHLALPARPARARMVILPDVRGLHPYYRDLAVRFAEAGYAAIAVDYYGRTTSDDERGEGFEFRPHMQRVEPANVAADVASGLTHLTEQGAEGASFTTGFCFGGSQSWRLSASEVDLAGVIGFYGRPQMVRDAVPRMRKPLLLLGAGADAATPSEEFSAFTEELAATGVPHEAHLYPGAPHSFFDRAYGEWAEACADAWRRILAFTDHRS